MSKKQKPEISSLVRQQKKKMIIDLASPLGNAYFLLAVAQHLAIHFGRDLNICERMTAGDYSNLINVFMSEFGDFVYLIADSNDGYCI